MIEETPQTNAPSAEVAQASPITPTDVVEPGSGAPPVLTSGETNPPVSTIPVHSAVAAHGVLSVIESELEKEFAKGQSHFLTWIKTKVNEIKLHLKV